MITELQLGEITVDVVQKDIKNVHLSVYPPTGRVRISAPLRMTAETIRVFAISKIGALFSCACVPARTTLRRKRSSRAGIGIFSSVPRRL
jgi:hypothetical protein